MHAVLALPLLRALAGEPMLSSVPDHWSGCRSELAARDASTTLTRKGAGMRLDLQVNKFDWRGGADQIGPTMARIARNAEEAGF